MDKLVAIGIDNYPSPMELSQCVQDVKGWVLPSLRQHRSGVASWRSTRILANRRATKANIMARVEWLKKNLEAGDRICFFYSGHGTYTPTSDPYESDGYDEAIVPVDYDGTDESLILDNVFTPLLCLPKTVYVCVFFDSCFSGGMDDFRSVRGIKKYPRNETAKIRRWMKKTLKELGNVVVIQACGERETAAETGNGGMLTSTFFRYFQKYPEVPLINLLENAKESVTGQAMEWFGNENLYNLPFLDDTWREKCLEFSS